MKTSYPNVRIKAIKPGVDPATILGSYRHASPRRSAGELLLAYRDSPILQAVVRKIASSVASAVWHGVIPSQLGGQDIVVPNHMAAKFLRRGSGMMSGQQMTELETVHYLLAGEAFSIIERDPFGLARTRIPIPPHWVRRVANPFDQYFEVYSPENGTTHRIHQSDMIWLKQVDAFDPYGRGGGVGVSLQDELRADESAAQHIAATLRNGALPSAIISGSKDAPLTEESVTRMRASFEDRFGGPQRAGRNFYSSVPLNVSTLGHNFRDLELTSIRQFERDIIVNAFGMPPEILGIIANSNRATIDAAEFLYTKHVVQPILVARRESINAQMEGEYPDGARVDFESPVDEDWEFKRAVMADRPTAYTDDEHRSVAGFAPLPDQAGEVTPADQPSDAPAPPPKGAQRNKAVDDGDLRRILQSINQNFFVDALSRAFRATFAQFGQATLDALGVGIDFTLRDPRVTAIIRESAASASTLIVGTTRDMLRETLAEGVDIGESSAQLVNRIRETVVDAGKTRAHTIARTEIVRASNAATTEAHRMAGIEEREWLATQDGNVRDTHRRLDGTRVGMEQPFSVDGRSGMYPGGFGVAALDINCRCGVVPADSVMEPDKRVKAWHNVEASRAVQEAPLESAVNAGFRRLSDQLESMILLATQGDA